MKLLIDHGAYDNLGDLGMLEAAVRRLLDFSGIHSLHIKACPLDESIWRLPRITRVDYSIPPPYRRLRGRGRIRRRLLGQLSPQQRRWLFLALSGSLVRPDRAPVLTERFRQSAAAFAAGYDGLYIAGGGDINDVFEDEIWNRACLIHAFAGQNKPVVLTGQQIGPFRCRASRHAVKTFLRRVRFIGLREPTDSLRFCRRAGLKPEQFAVLGDDTLGLPEADPAKARSLLDAAGLSPGKFIAVNIRVSDYAGGTRPYLQAFAHLACALGDHYRMPVVAIPIALDPGDSDVTSGEHLAGFAAPGRIRVQPGRDLTPSLAKAVMGNAFAALGVSYHFCTFALEQGVPALAFYEGDYYRQKALGLAAHWHDDRLACPLARITSSAELIDLFDDRDLRTRLANQGHRDRLAWKSFFHEHIPAILGF